MTEHQVIDDRYEVLSELGAGAVAVVYKVRDKYLNREFALKMMKNEQASGEQLIRFQQEALLVSKLQHTSISTVYHCGVTDENQPFLVMDFHDGKTLSDELEASGPLSLDTAIDVFLQICEGISYSHKQGVLHRDLKASNVILIRDGTSSDFPKVRILDFGLAKMTCSSGGVLTRPGMALGSPAYMSPEHAHGKALDERSDVYSMGCVMFESLTGRAPIRGVTPVDTILKQISQPAPTLSSVAEGKSFDPALERTVARCLEKDPANRFQSMEELSGALQGLKELRATPDKGASDAVNEPQRHVPAGVLIVGLVVALCVSAGVFFTVALLQETQVQPTLASSQTKGGNNTSLEVDAPPTVGSTDVDPDSDDPFMNWLDMKWEGGVTWKWNHLKVDDQELDRISKLPNFTFVSLYKAKDVFSSEGLRVLLRSPHLRGLGVGECDLKLSQFDDIINIAPHLEALLLMDNPKLADKELRKLKRLPKLWLLDLTRCKFTDEGLSIVAQLPKISFLKLVGMPEITGSGLRYLVSMKELRTLSLRDTEIVDASGWKSLARMKQLKVLSVANTGLDDLAMDEIKKLSLERLDVSLNPYLSGFGLKSLASMKTLKRLYLVNCKRVTNRAAAELQRALPDCEILYQVRNSGERSADEVLL